MRELDVRAPFWERLDAEYEKLCWLEKRGDRTVGAATSWYGEIHDAVVGLQEDAELYATLPESIDPTGAYRSRVAGQWRIVFRVEADRIVVLTLWHVRQSPSPRELE